MIDLNLNPSRKELRWFAVGLIIFFSIVAWFVYKKTDSLQTATLIAGAAAVVGLIGFCLPTFMRWIYVPWVLAAYPIGWTVSHILLGIIFYGLFTPIGFLMRLSGRDPMQRSFDKSAQTYWIERPENQGTKRYFRQF